MHVVRPDDVELDIAHVQLSVPVEIPRTCRNSRCLRDAGRWRIGPASVAGVSTEQHTHLREADAEIAGGKLRSPRGDRSARDMQMLVKSMLTPRGAFLAGARWFQGWSSFEVVQ